MARKFLLPMPDKKPKPDKKYSCYMCYVCPKDCYLSPLSPPPPPPPTPQKHHFSTILILMFCVLGVAFVILSYLTISRYRNRSSQRRNPGALENQGNLTQDFLDENQGPVLDHPIWYIRTVGLPQSVIDSIAVFKYRKGDGLIEGCDCSVCLSEFQENESLRLLPKCSHAFHLPCIDTWLRSHKNCPVCRAPILLPDVANNNVQVSSVEASTSNSSGSVEETINQAQNETEETRGNRGVSDQNRSSMPIQDDESFKSPSVVNDVEKFRVLSDLAHRRVESYQELQQFRRSVSVDFSSASMIYHTVTNKKFDEGCSGNKLEEIVENQNLDKRDFKNSGICRLIKSYSSGRSLQKGPVSMKRSFSYSGKRSLRKNSRSLELISLPEISIEKQ